MSLITATSTILCVLCVFLDKNTQKNSIFYHFWLIPVNKFWSVQTWRSLRDVISARIGVHCARLFVRLRLCANGSRDNANVTRRSHYQKSLLRDSDRAVFHAKFIIIYVDWIALLRRFLLYLIYVCVCLQVVSMLLHQGAKCNIKDARGNSPLHYCCLNGHADPAKILINVSSDGNNKCHISFKDSLFAQ